MLNPTLNFMVITFASYWGTTSREGSTTGETIFMAVITTIYGQAIPMLLEQNSYIWAKGRSINILQQSPSQCNAFPDKELQ